MVVDFRRYLRPFFLNPATNSPLPTKRYYDIFSFLVTQLTFSFVVAPFLILSFSGSIKAWSRVYFYAIIGTAASMAFFASPAKPMLKKKLEARAARAGVVKRDDRRERKDGQQGEKEGDGEKEDKMYMHRNASADSLREPLLGMPSDPQQELDDAINEIRGEIEEKRRLAGVQAERVRQRVKAAQGKS